MQEEQKKFKKVPKRFQPRGLSILYEDEDILVVDKISGLLTMGTDTIKDNTAYYLLTNYVRKGNLKSKKRIFIVHRLDRDTSGVLVFAKHEKAKRFLQDEWQSFNKTYYTVVHGILPEKEGVIESFLTENQAHKVYSVPNEELGKLAKTGYKVLREARKYSLVEIELLTGRKNQIRAHFAEKGFPVAGDRVYGKKDETKRLALHAASLTIKHPHSKKEMTFSAPLPDYFQSLVKSSLVTNPSKATNKAASKVSSEGSSEGSSEKAKPEPKPEHKFKPFKK